MREIKFRAWRKDEIIMYDNVQDTYDYMTEVPASSFADLLCDEDWVVMQYTGLKDKNGKEIYEGDILEWNQFAWGCEHREIAKWDYELLSTRRNDWKQFCEIIGNIYENKELLK